jgi:hypothetical protein
VTSGARLWAAAAVVPIGIGAGVGYYVFGGREDGQIPTTARSAPSIYKFTNRPGAFL